MSRYMIHKPQLNLAGAERLLALGLAEARARELALCLAVTDAHGQLLGFARMDGAGLVSIEVAIGKARTAAWLQAPAALFEEKIDNGAPSILSCRELTPLRGGEPVRLGAAIIGGFGVSGAAGAIDGAVAEAVVAAFATEAETAALAAGAETAAEEVRA